MYQICTWGTGLSRVGMGWDLSLQQGNEEKPRKLILIWVTYAFLKLGVH